MKKAAVIEYFGGVEKTAIALGISKGAVSQWGKDIPLLRAYEIERITGGALSAAEKVKKTKQCKFEA